MLPLPVLQASFAVLTADGSGLAASERGPLLHVQSVSVWRAGPVFPEHRPVGDPLEPFAEEERVQRDLVCRDALYRPDGLFTLVPSGLFTLCKWR